MKLAISALEDVGSWKALLLDVTIKGGALSKTDLSAFGSALKHCASALDGAQSLLETLPVGSAARAKAEDALHSTMELYIEATAAYTPALSRSSQSSSRRASGLLGKQACFWLRRRRQRRPRRSRPHARVLLSFAATLID